MKHSLTLLTVSLAKAPKQAQFTKFIFWISFFNKSAYYNIVEKTNGGYEAMGDFLELYTALVECLWYMWASTIPTHRCYWSVHGPHRRLA